MATEATKEALASEETFQESFIREILRLDSFKQDLLNLRDSLLINGDVEKAHLLTLLSPAGENFNKTFNSIRQLRVILDQANLSDFSEVYLRRCLSHHHRYLGYHKLAWGEFSDFMYYDANNVLLNTHILNSRHMNRYKDFLPREDFSDALIADNQELASSYMYHFGSDISSLSAGAFQEARVITSECAALKGLYFANICMSATNEDEALSGLCCANAEGGFIS